jgi:hypothetical protein
MNYKNTKIMLLVILPCEAFVDVTDIYVGNMHIHDSRCTSTYISSEPRFVQVVTFLWKILTFIYRRKLYQDITKQELHVMNNYTGHNINNF